MLDLPAMKRGITDLKDQIKKLGDVNVNAIEDYKNLMERYTFMKTQHDDLVEAEKTLEGIIEELDGAMRKQFTEKFAQISRNLTRCLRSCSAEERAPLSSWRMKISWRRESALSHSRRERSCRT